MVPETGRRVPRARQDNRLRRGPRYESAGGILPELEVAVLVARVLGARERDVKNFLALS